MVRGYPGLVTEITLKLAATPEKTAVAVVTFPSMRAAAQTAIEIIHKAVLIGAVEILDEVQMSVIHRVGGTHRVWKELPTLFFKFAGSQGSVTDAVTQIGEIVKKHGGSDFEFAQGELEQQRLWSVRKETLWNMLSLRGSGREVWSTDVAVPLPRVADLIVELISATRVLDANVEV